MVDITLWRLSHTRKTMSILEALQLKLRTGQATETTHDDQGCVGAEGDEIPG